MSSIPTGSEAEWLSSGSVHDLLRHAARTWDCDRKLRLFSVACIRRVELAYDSDVTALIEAAERLFDEGVGSLAELQGMAESVKGVAPFHLARRWPLAAALGVVDGILEDTSWTDCGCLPVLREVFGNPYRPVTCEEISRHLREVKWHPRGCWATDHTLGKGILWRSS